MSKSVGEVNFKLVSQYDDTGVRLAMKDLDDSKRMIAGMTAAAGGSVSEMAQQMADANKQQVEVWRQEDVARRQSQVALNAQRATALNEEAAKSQQMDLERRQAAVLLATQKRAALDEEAAKSQEIDVSRRQAAVSFAEQRQAAIAEEEAKWRKSLYDKSNAMNMGGAALGVPPDLTKSLAEESANRQKQLDREVWAERGRLRDADTQKETASLAAREKTEKILAQARILSADTIERKRQQDLASQQMSATVEDTRHQRAINHILQEDAVSNSGGIGKNAARNLQQAGFALQDFSSQIQNSKTVAEGFGRGFAAISNNIQMMGAGLSPVTQASFAIGGAVAGIIVPAVAKWLLDTEEIEKKNKDIKEQFTDMKSAVDGIGRGELFRTEGKKGAEKARDAISELTNKITAAANTSKTLRQMIEDERVGDNDQVKINALRQHWDETTKEIAKAEAERTGIQKQWSAVRLRDELAAIAKEKKTKAELIEFEKDQQKQRQSNLQALNERERRDRDREKAELDMKQFEKRVEIEDLRDAGINPSGSSSASIRGTSEATSAINRAIAGTRSEESDRKQTIKVLEDQLKALNRLEQKMNFKRAGLGA